VIAILQQGPLAIFAAFVVVHALADFPLQGEYLARQKKRETASSKAEWLVALAAHSVIHGGGVWLVLFGGGPMSKPGIPASLRDTIPADF